MAPTDRTAITRRRLLIGGGAGAGLMVAWAVWPRRYAPNLTMRDGETAFGAYIKIGVDGQVTVAVPQAEHGQGVYTALPQIVADELGADWRTVAVEAAPINPLYANPLAAGIVFGDALALLPRATREAHATRTTLMLTAGSTSIRRFEAPLREAGAAARILLCKAAAAEWGGDWRSCGTADGFVVMGDRRARFGELAEAAASETLPGGALPLRTGIGKRLVGEALPRLDAPAKVDGSARFAGDVRLPGMVFASIRQGPIGDTRLRSIRREAVRGMAGVRAIVEAERWVAVAASNWWAANRAVDALEPSFETHGLVDDRSIAAALASALDGEGARMHSAGDVEAAFEGGRIHRATYGVGAALHAAIEPTTATAVLRDGTLTLWMPTLAPNLAKAAAAHAIGLSEDSVVLHPTVGGGSFGAHIEHRVAEQAAVLARRLDRPVQLTWSRGEDCLADRYRTPAAATMMARIGRGGAIRGWHAKLAVPQVGRELGRRLLEHDLAATIGAALPGKGDGLAIEGAVPAYAVANVAVDHHAAELGLPAGWWRSGAHSYTAFFNECFVDELAAAAGMEAHSFRIGMLGNDVRLARCLTLVANLGGWQGGAAGSGQGIACHRMRGSAIACMAEAHVEAGGRIRVDRFVAAVDCGRVVNPDLVRQQIEGGLIFGMAAALGGSTGFRANLPDARGFAGLALPRLADAPEVMIELVESDADPGGISELAVPVAAPAIANALHTVTGRRHRMLPLQGRTD